MNSRGLLPAGLVFVATMLAFWAFWSWTTAPFEWNGSFLGGADNAKHIIDDLFPYRLVQPSWLPQTNDLVIQWERAEEHAREIVVISLWFVFVLFVILRDAKRLHAKT